MHRLSPAVLIAALIVCACDQPPTKEIAAAQAALAVAEQQDAAKYAPERLDAARAALEDAQRKLQAQDYRGALSAANEATEKARAASKSADAAKQLTRSAAESARDEARILLDEMPPLKDAATEAKVAAEAFTELDAELAAVQALLVSSDQALAKNDFLSARNLAEDARSRVQVLPDKYRQARSDWETAHPKKPKRSPAKKAKKR
jgi:hypothetical protein